MTDTAQTSAPEQGQAPADPQVTYSQSGELVPRLGRLGVSLMVSSHQSGLLYCLGCNPQGGLQVHQAAMPKPMGITWETGEEDCAAPEAGTPAAASERASALSYTADTLETSQTPAEAKAPLGTAKQRERLT